MTPKEKANELFDKYNYELSNHIFNGTFDIAKECALIAVDELQEFITKYDNHMKDYMFWQEVKQELEKL